MFGRRAWAFGFGVTLALAVSLALPLSGLASDTQVVQLRDDCDPASFNAAIGPGTCVGNGTTTFSEFIAELQEDKVASDWVFDPDQVTVHVGDKLTIQNTGGETHSFTKVTSFGGGLILPLNVLSGNLVLAVPAPGVNVFATFVPAGGVTTVSSASGGILTPGQNLFECFIHPWMRAVVTVETD